MDEADHGQVELTETNELTPQRIGEYVALMVEAAPSLLGEETLAELRKFVETIRADGGYVPVPERFWPPFRLPRTSSDYFGSS